MKLQLAASAAAVTAIALSAACSGAHAVRSQAGAAASRTAQPAAAGKPAPAATPSEPAVPLTTAQAAAAYARLIDPLNRAGVAVSTDLSDGVPFSQVRADAMAQIAANKKVEQQLLALRWPPPGAAVCHRHDIDRSPSDRPLRGGYGERRERRRRDQHRIQQPGLPSRGEQE